MIHALSLILLLAVPPAAPEPADAVDSWHAALRGAERTAVLDLMLPDVVIFEAGFAETSRDEYAAQHLDADMAFARGTATKVEKRQVVELGADAALVLSHTSTAGTFEGKPIASSGVETMVLRRTDGRWRIAHVHWSSRRR